MMADAWVAVDRHEAMVGGPTTTPIVARNVALVRHLDGCLTEHTVIKVLTPDQRQTMCNVVGIRTMRHSDWKAARQLDLEVALSS